MANQFSSAPVNVCIFGRVNVTPNPSGFVGATNGTLTPVLSSNIPISQAISPAAGAVSLNQVDGGMAIVCGILTSTGIQVTQVIPQSAGAGAGTSGIPIGNLGTLGVQPGAANLGTPVNNLLNSLLMLGL